MKRLALFLLVAAMLVVAPVSARAELGRETPPNRANREGMENFKQARDEVASGEIRAARNDAKCAVVTAYINGRLTHYDERKRAYIERHQKLAERVKTLIIKLEEKGYDVTQVRADLVTLAGLMDTAEADFKTFIGKLEATKQYDCADANGQFLTAFREAQTALKTFHDDVAKIREFVSTTLRPHIKALRDQDPASATQQLRERTGTSDDSTR